MTLQAADAAAQAGGGQFHFLPYRQQPVNQGAGDHGAKAGNGKAAVDRQARPAQVRPRPGLIQYAVDFLFQFGQSGPGVGRHPQHGAAGKGSAGYGILHFRLDQFHQFVVHQVGFGDHYQALADAEDVQNRQMFPGLLHYAFVGGDNQQSQVNSADAGQHIFDKALVARHIHDADFPAAGQSQPGKAQVHGHLPFLFLGQTIRVNVGQSLDQGGFAVIDMAGGADNIHQGTAPGGGMGMDLQIFYPISHFVHRKGVASQGNGVNGFADGILARMVIQDAQVLNARTVQTQVVGVPGVNNPSLLAGGL